MGAQGSKSSAPNGQTAGEEAEDYYTLLQVSEEASQDEIRVGKPLMLATCGYYYLTWSGVDIEIVQKARLDTSS